MQTLIRTDHLLGQQYGEKEGKNDDERGKRYEPCTQRFPGHRAPRLRLLGGLADLPEEPILQAVLLPSEFQEHVLKQCTLDVVVTTAEAPCIKSNAMETLRTTPTILLHRIARQIRPIKLLDTASSLLPNRQANRC